MEVMYIYIVIYWYAFDKSYFQLPIHQNNKRITLQPHASYTSNICIQYYDEKKLPDSGTYIIVLNLLDILFVLIIFYY